jgi:hypothetical protein
LLVALSLIGLVGTAAFAQTIITVGQVRYVEFPIVLPCDAGGQWMGPWNFEGVINPGLRGAEPANDDRDWAEIVHAVVLPPPSDSTSSFSRRVLLICRRHDVGWLANPYGGDIAAQSFIWDKTDPENLTMQVVNPNVLDGSRDPFCGGHALTAGGNVLLVGGTDEKKQVENNWTIWGSKYAYLFVNKAAPYWVYQDVATAPAIPPVPPMQRARWYPTAVRAFDGSIVVTGHAANPVLVPASSKTRERADVDDIAETVTWRQYSGSALLNNLLEGGPGLECSGTVLADLLNYSRMHQLISGDLFASAGASHVLSFDTCADISNPDRLVAMSSALTSAPEATIVHLIDLTPLSGPTEVFYAVGGNVSGLYGLATDEVLRMDVNTSNPAASIWTDTNVPQLNAGRVYSNTVILLDGSLVTFGGVSQDPDSGIEVYFKHPELFKPPGIFETPSTNWQYLNPQEHERTYHSVAVLLPTGDVVSAGGQGTSVFSDPPDRPMDPVPPWYSVELFRPAYMCSPYRPVITSAPTTIELGFPEPIGLTVKLQSTSSGGETRVALVAPGAANTRWTRAKATSSSGLFLSRQTRIRCSHPRSSFLHPPTGRFHQGGTC